MKRARLLAVALALVLVCSAAWSDVRVLFSPGGDCDKAIAALMKNATATIDAACYTFTLADLADELVAAHKRGVKVRLLVDHMTARQQYSQASNVAAGRVPVNQNIHSGLMHHKFVVTDGQNVATGSFNWTAAAVNSNDENLVLFSKEPEVAKQFSAQFETMWDNPRRFGPFHAPRPPSTAPRPSTYGPPSATSGTTVYITRTGQKYHRGSCRYLRQSKIAISKHDALARGKGACSVCKP